MFNLDHYLFLTHRLMRRFSQPFFILFILFHLVAFVSAGGPITIESLTAYSIQRDCVQDCVWDGTPGGGPNLPQYLSCAQPFSDSCICRTDLSASAINYLTSCVNSVCSGNTVDVSNAVSLYTGYCNSDLSMIAFAASVTIERSNPYSSLRFCAQQCLWGGTDGGGLPLPQAIGCSNNLNACMCRADLSPSASSFLTTCVDSNCSGDMSDLSSALAAYTVYCNAALATTTSASAAASTSSASPSPSSTLAMSTSAVSSPATTNQASTAPATTSSSTTVPTPVTTSGATSTAWTGGKIAGVTIGSIAGVFLIIFPIGCVWRRSRGPKPVPSPEAPDPVSPGPDSTSKGESKITQTKVDDGAKELASADKKKPKVREIEGSPIQEVDADQAREIGGSRIQEAGGAQLREMDASHVVEIDSKEV